MGHRHYVEGILIIVTACLFSFTATVASAATPGCGDANNDQSVTASDALSTLKTAVGSLSCDKVRCDVNDDGGISAADALLVLKLSVGQSVSLVCPGVAIASVSALPQATAPVASEGQDAQASLATSAAMVANLGASGPSAIPIGADDDFFTELGGDVHANPSIGACEMVNRVRNAVNWTAEADKMLCYVKEVMASDTDSSIDLYDGTPHVVELNIAHPGFCAAAPTPTSCRDDAECGADGPCLAFDQQGKDNIHVKLLMARNGDEVDGTITNFEMFVCEDVPSETYDLTIELDDTVTFTALQVEVDYSALVGGFEGFDADVECTSPLTDSGVLFAANDDDASKTLSLGFISLSEVQGPVTLASCSFLEQGAGMQISDFVVTVVDAVDGNGASIRPACSVGEVQGADQGTVQVQYLHQTIDGNSFSMVSKGIFSDEFGTGAHSATVLATLNDLGQFTGSKTINIASSFADAGFGFNGVTEETFIQDANTIYMTGIEQGSFPGEDFDGDGVVDGGADSHLNRVIGYAQLVDGNSDLTDYDIDLLGIGIGAAKASMKGSFSFVPCTMDTCGFEESCERLELAETEDGRCLDEWEFALVEGWNASALVDDAAAVDFISEVVDAELPSYSGVAISFSPSESYDCSGAVEATIDVDMFAIMQTCGEMMVEHDNFASCYDTAGGKE
ncbi:MAG: dockerin type I domain-containing protein, partial [Candidatus Binatia bacterium]